MHPVLTPWLPRPTAQRPLLPRLYPPLPPLPPMNTLTATFVFIWSVCTLLALLPSAASSSLLHTLHAPTRGVLVELVELAWGGPADRASTVAPAHTLDHVVQLPTNPRAPEQWVMDAPPLRFEDPSTATVCDDSCLAEESAAVARPAPLSPATASLVVRRGRAAPSAGAVPPAAPPPGHRSPPPAVWWVWLLSVTVLTAVCVTYFDWALFLV